MPVHASHRYFATGGADALVTLWEMDELVPVRTFRRLEYAVPSVPQGLPVRVALTCAGLCRWPVRTVSFTHDGAYLAMGSEDAVIDIVRVGVGMARPLWALAWPVQCHRSR
jgi:THO complex subunit 3